MRLVFVASSLLVCKFGSSILPSLSTSVSSPTRRLSYSFERKHKHQISAMVEDAQAYNDFVSADVDLSNAHISKSGLLTVIRSVRDIDNDKRRKYLYNIPLCMSNIHIPPSELPSDILLRLPSPSGRKIAIFRTTTSHPSTDTFGKEVDPKQILEIWIGEGQTLQRRIELTCGKVIVDAAGFGIPSWHPDETALVLIVERPTIKLSSFFDDRGATAQVGNENVLGVGKREHWGEKYAHQNPIHDICCINVSTGRVGRVDNVPGDVGWDNTNAAGYTLGQPVFETMSGKDGEQSIVYTGWDAGGNGAMPRRLGLIYCQQRPCQLYRSNISILLNRLATESPESNTQVQSIPPYTTLTANHKISHSPRLTPDGSKLVFLTSKQGFDTHSGCFQLGVINMKQTMEPTIVVDTVWEPDDNSKETGTVAGLYFPGLFTGQLPMKCFPSSESLLMNTQWGSCQKVIQIFLTDGRIRLLECSNGSSNLSSDELMCISPDGDAIVQVKTPSQPASLHLIQFCELDRSYQINKVASKMLTPMTSTKFSPLVLTFSSQLSFDVRVIDTPVVSGTRFQGKLQSILLLPDKSRFPLPKLVVLPHGGPHSCSSTTYVPTYSYLCGYGGYAILLVNYHGSTGFGQASIEALPTNIGNLDLQDVLAAVREVQESGLVDSTKMGICGGSHGGFLTAHITSRFPDLFAAAVLRNPVVNIASMVTATDIPDWCYVESSGMYCWNEYKPPSKSDLDTFYLKSPIQYIKNVKTPTLVALGMKDLRVPPSQGMEWYFGLRSQGVETTLLMYDNDDHAIDGVASEADHWINIKRWFDQHLL